ncbi:MAG: AAA family ATPase, partial [Chitinophagaceae bacterium]|nr:AAA family ATPase [Chitinophagaceae bacterium]
MSKYHTQAIDIKQPGAIKSFYSNIFSRYKGKSKSIIMFPGFLVLFLLVFTDKFSEIISAALVKPLFSTLHQSSIIIDLICIFGGLSVILFFVIKGIRLVRLSVLLELYIFSLTFIYLYFRFFDTSRYDFVRFRSNLVSFLSLADILLSFIIGVVCYYLFYAIKFVMQYKHQPPLHEGFFTDTPLILEESSDILGRFGYVKDLAHKILATNSPNHSFAIGIIGEWGAGKTTFLSTLENIFEKEQQVVQLRFNPWATRNSENISAIFFSDLAARLSEFDESLKTNITDYSKKLLQSTDSNSLGVIKQLFEFSTEKKEFHEQYEIINQSIQSLKRKIVVYIDDVDRLDKKEVIEVLRIVRNTANFGSVFFVVAFDKAYVTASVNEALINKSEKYLEKIFQLEYYLPLQPNRLVYRNELLGHLRKYVPQSCLQVLDYIENPSSTLFGSFEILPKISDYITTFRDVNR